MPWIVIVVIILNEILYFGLWVVSHGFYPLAGFVGSGDW